MKNKKGFTLIEILAAVTILGVLSVVAVISVNNIIQKSKQKHYTTAEENFELAGQSYVQQNRSALPKVIGQKKKIFLKTLVEKNYIEPIKDYSENDCDLNNSYVQVFKYSQNDYSYIAFLDCPVYDSKEQIEKSSPRAYIILNSQDKVKTAQAHVKAEDNEKLLSWSYIIYKDKKEVLNSGSVMIPSYEKSVEKSIDISKYTPGKIKVVVTATNIYGLTTTVTSQTVEYKDEQGPTCIIKEVDKPINPKPWTQTAKTITVGCDDGEGSGCTRKEYTKTFKTTTVNGDIIIEDNSGNKTTCEVSVNVDTTAPECQVNLSGTRGDNNWYKTRNVSVSLTTTDMHSGVGSYDLSTSTTPSYIGKTSATQSDSAGIIWYGYVKDNVGNINKCNSGSFKVDTTPPSCTVTKTGTSGNNGWYKSNVSLTLNPSDNLSGIAQTGLSTSTTPTLGSIKTGTQGDTANITWYGRVKDNAGNISDVCNSGAFKVDTTNPTCSVTFSGTSGNNGWYTSNATVSLTTNDALSKVEKYGLTTSGSATYNSTSSSTQGNTAGQNWNGYVMDYAGNTNSCNNSVKVDTTPPSCTISLSGTAGNNGWYKSNNVTVTLNPSDALSGVAQTGLATSLIPALGSTTSGSQGNTAGITWYGRVQDAAGNISATCNSGSFKVDTTKPSLTLNNNPGTYNGEVTVTPSCSDALSGVASKSSSTTIAAPNCGTNKSFTCTDNAGNSTSKSGTYITRIYSATSACEVNQYKRCSKCSCESGYTTTSYSGTCYLQITGMAKITKTCTKSLYDSGGCSSWINTQLSGYKGSYDSGGSCKKNTSCSLYKRCSKCEVDSYKECWHC